MSFYSSTTENAIPSYFTISKNYSINYTISFYNTSNIPKLYYFTILLKYYFFNLSLLFLSNKPFFSKFNYSNGQFSTTCHFFFSISFQLFQQPANFFIFLFFLRRNMTNINVLKLADFKNPHANFPCRLRPFSMNLIWFFSIFRARLVRDF